MVRHDHNKKRQGFAFRLLWMLLLCPSRTAVLGWTILPPSTVSTAVSTAASAATSATRKTFLCSQPQTHQEHDPQTQDQQEWVLADARNEIIIKNTEQQQQQQQQQLDYSLPTWWQQLPAMLPGQETPVVAQMPRSGAFTIGNPTPRWVAVAAQVVLVTDEITCSSNLFQVTPTLGCLAPSGGTTNLENETERFQDFCEFQVTVLPPVTPTTTPTTTTTEEDDDDDDDDDDDENYEEESTSSETDEDEDDEEDSSPSLTLQKKNHYLVIQTDEGDSWMLELKKSPLI